jgi:hypothetical protein
MSTMTILLARIEHSNITSIAENCGFKVQEYALPLALAPGIMSTGT